MFKTIDSVRALRSRPTTKLEGFPGRDPDVDHAGLVVGDRPAQAGGSQALGWARDHRRLGPRRAPSRRDATNGVSGSPYRSRHSSRIFGDRRHGTASTVCLGRRQVGSVVAAIAGGCRSCHQHLAGPRGQLLGLWPGAWCQDLGERPGLALARTQSWFELTPLRLRSSTRQVLSRLALATAAWAKRGHPPEPSYRPVPPRRCCERRVGLHGASRIHPDALALHQTRLGEQRQPKSNTAVWTSWGRRAQIKWLRGRVRTWSGRPSFPHLQQGTPVAGNPSSATLRVDRLKAHRGGILEVAPGGDRPKANPIRTVMGRRPPRRSRRSRPRFQAVVANAASSDKLTKSRCPSTSPWLLYNPCPAPS